MNLGNLTGKTVRPTDGRRQTTWRDELFWEQSGVTRSFASQELTDLRPDGLGGAIAVVFPVLEASDAHSKCFRNFILRCSQRQTFIQQQLAQWSFLVGKRWRIVPYGPDQKLAKRVQKPPLPPTFLIYVITIYHFISKTRC